MTIAEAIRGGTPVLWRRRKRRAAESSLVRPAASIVPRDTITSRALLMVIAIMTFVAAIIVGAVDLVRDAAVDWRSDMAREVTIQVRPVQGRDIAAEIGKAVEVARRTPGIADARSLTRDETSRLLEPWLGTGVDLSALPLPRLIVVRLDEKTEADLTSLRRSLASEVSGASLDDHRTWSARLAAISDAIVIAGTALLGLVLAATTLSVSFATRGAVATNRAVVEVLHLVGARDSYIAGTFQRHFLAIGLKGGLIGGVAAAVLFAFTGLVPGVLSWIPGGGDAASLTGQFSLNRQGYLGIAGIVVLVALVTALASRITVRKTLREID
jgi:cell division transport system permease protein